MKSFKVQRLVMVAQALSLTLFNEAPLTVLNIEGESILDCRLQQIN